jgi:hypothetical protein
MELLVGNLTQPLTIALNQERTLPRTLKLGNMLQAPDLYLQLKDLKWVLNQGRLAIFRIDLSFQDMPSRKVPKRCENISIQTTTSYCNL